MNKVIHGDSLVELKTLEDNSVDSIVTDPPYELGFMGKSWDDTGIANNVELWKECLRVLKPGGHLLSFGGTRTYHRMAVAIEDAGFEVRDMIEWCYGSGFPKSHNFGKAVDKLQGNDRKVEKHHTQSQKNPDIHAGGSVHITMPNNWKITKGTSEYEGWGTSLKPAHEPICMARKPLSEKTIAKNCLKWGTGGINIDESRVETSDDISGVSSKTSIWGDGESNQVKSDGNEKGGRFPANLIHDNSEEVRECFPDTKSSKKAQRGKGSDGSTGIYGFYGGETTERGHDDNGGNASRYFKSIIYQAKASKRERNKGCEGLEEKENQQKHRFDRGDKNFNGKPSSNNHPTVKPIALMEYLIKIVTPKGGIVLDPFAGSGTTLVAAKKNGYQYVGIEMTEEYLPIIEARLNAHGE